MKRKICLVLVLNLLAVLCVSLFMNYKQYRKLQERPVSEVVTAVEYRERKDTMPNVSDERPVGQKIVKLPVAKNTISDENYMADSTILAENYMSDSTEVMVPITQKVYKDSLYTAWVSGYAQSLDSISIREKLVTTTITQEASRKWNVGLAAGYGYGIGERKMDFFVGVAVTYNIFPEKKRLRR